MALALIAIFLAGIANFAMHRTALESDDPMIQAAVKPFQDRLGPYVTYAIEFLFLVAAMSIANRHWFAGLMLYGVYTIVNVAAFTIIRNRPR